MIFYALKSIGYAHKKNLILTREAAFSQENDGGRENKNDKFSCHIRVSPSVSLCTVAAPSSDGAIIRLKILASAQVMCDKREKVRCAQNRLCLLT